MISETPRFDVDHPEPGGHAPGTPDRSCRHGGFTLVELLVVMAVIALLAALLFPASRESLRKAHATKCLSAMRQMGLAVQLFAVDHDGRLPGTAHGDSWTNSLTVYLGRNFIGRCPAVPRHRARVTYGWNDCLATNGAGMSVALLEAPSLTMAMAELAIDQSSEHFHFSGVRGGPARLTPNQFKAAVNVEVHGVGANYLFVDGHVANVAWAEVQRLLTQANSSFIVP